MPVYKIQVVTPDGIFWWSENALVELRWQATTFDSLEVCEVRMRAIKNSHPGWVVQRKLAYHDPLKENS